MTCAMTRTFFRMRTITIRAAIVAVLVAGALAGRPGGLPIAAADATLSISTTPALMPAFDPAIKDYAARCGTSATIAAPVTVTASAPAGSTVSVAGGVPASGNDLDDDEPRLERKLCGHGASGHRRARQTTSCVASPRTCRW